MPNTVETKIEEILESIRPALKTDGGDVEFLRFNEEGGVVELRLLGACEDCPISMMTLRGGSNSASRVVSRALQRFRRFKAPRSPRQFDRIR